MVLAVVVWVHCTRVAALVAVVVLQPHTQGTHQAQGQDMPCGVPGTECIATASEEAAGRIRPIRMAERAGLDCRGDGRVLGSLEGIDLAVWEAEHGRLQIDRILTICVSC